ncbi:hypothetical protein E2493_15130 [Sphingomonas parva]|uniref:Uncharacterized protein n=1 Tax=Sphingomonas parva TaxID=2555898 RepID=A0A4Y8ZN32_9SPHN|nr:hypothetical protein [Sphingomonas parva]TFI57410.1 hypothetical protein E2493_15130 [Sphingomonas parva]
MIAFASLLLAGLSSAAAQGVQPDPATFRRDTPAVAPQGGKGGQGMGRISKESVAIAACRARAATLGAATFGDLRLAGYRTYLITGTIVPPRGRGRTLSYRCTVRGAGEILDFKTARAPR